MSELSSIVPPLPSGVAKTEPSPKPGPSKPNPVDAVKGFVRPLRDAVQHVIGEKRCPITIIRRDHADFHARSPGVIDRVQCSTCRGTFAAKDFVWAGGDEPVGS